MKKLKPIILLILLFLISTLCYSQDKKKQLYFLADTTVLNKKSKILEIKNDIEITYTFFCKCLAPNNSNITFGFLTSKEGRKTSNVKPSFNYIAWKKLLEIAENGAEYFNKNYELVIVEALANNSYRTNKVRFIPFKKPTIHFEKIEQ